MAEETGREFAIPSKADVKKIIKYVDEIQSKFNNESFSYQLNRIINYLLDYDLNEDSTNYYNKTYHAARKRIIEDVVIIHKLIQDSKFTTYKISQVLLHINTAPSDIDLISLTLLLRRDIKVVLESDNSLELFNNS